MAFLGNKQYRYYVKQRRKASRSKNLPLIFLVLFFSGLVIGAGYLIFSTIIQNRKSDTLSLNTNLWDFFNEGKYQQVIASCEQNLKSNPLDPNALMLYGFSNYYVGIRQFTYEEKLPYLEEAIKALRKIMALPKDNISREQRAMVLYVLGKAYYHKEKYYYDLALKYLSESQELGYKGEDTDEYLAFANYELNFYEKAAEFFNKALKDKTSDITYFNLSEVYYKMGRLSEAEANLLEALALTKNPLIEEKSRSLLGEIYYQKKDYEKAITEYEKVIEINPKSDDAHYHLGMIYNAMGQRVKARSELRTALRLNPNHRGAIIALQK